MVGGDSASGLPSASWAVTGAVGLAGGGDLTVVCFAAPVAVALAARGGLTVACQG
jgi:hypothetical protein